MEPGAFDEDRTLILSSSFELDEYLSSNVILWRLKGSLPPLTPGNLMLAMKRIKYGNDDQIIQAIEKIQSITDRRKAAWEKKINAELPLRLQQWKAIVEDIVEYGGIEPSYNYNVRVRVIITLLMDALTFPDVKFNDLLLLVDQMLNQIAINDGFVWNPELEESFPRERYGFLYLK